MKQESREDLNIEIENGKNVQPCPKCGFLIGVVAGSKEAICRNCGFKDPCCE